MVQSQGAGPFTIGKLAAAAGVGVETVRFYQRRGLLQTPPRERGITWSIESAVRPQYWQR